jgi:hypothetical protein
MDAALQNVLQEQNHSFKNTVELPINGLEFKIHPHLVCNFNDPKSISVLKLSSFMIFLSLVFKNSNQSAIQPGASRYTVCTIPAQWCSIYHAKCSILLATATLLWSIQDTIFIITHHQQVSLESGQHDVL